MTGHPYAKINFPQAFYIIDAVHLLINTFRAIKLESRPIRINRVKKNVRNIPIYNIQGRKI